MSFFASTRNQQPATPKKLLNINDDALNSNQQAVPVKVFAGRNYLGGDYISPAYNPKAIPIKTQAGKGNSETTGYKYFADFALVFCCGGRRPVDALYTVIIDSDIAWQGNVQRGQAQYETIQVPNFGSFRLYWGSETQPIDTALLTPRSTAIGGGDQQDSTTWPANAAHGGQTTFGGLASGDSNPYSGHYDKHPAYRGQCYAVFTNWKLGRDRTSVPNVQLELKRGCPWFNGAFIAADDRGVNPAAFLFDIFTDTRFGAGFPESSLLKITWDGTYNALEALGARISPLITSQSEFREIVAQALEYFDGWIRRNGTQIELGLWSHGTVVSAATLTDDDLLGDPELTPTGWAQTINELTIVYKERLHHYNDYVQNFRDPNNFRITGAPRADTLQRPWITDGDLAKAYARTYGAIQALPYTSGALHVKREWLSIHSMLPGKIFTYNSAFYGLSFLMRLLEVEYPADKDAKATMTVQWESSKWPSLYIPPGLHGPGGFTLGPRAIWKSRITEVPYLLADHKFVTQVVTLGVKGNHEVVGFRVWASFDAGATYQDLVNSNHFGFYGRVDATFAANSGSVHMHFYGIGLDRIETQTPAQQLDDTLICFIDAEVVSIGVVAPSGNAGDFNVHFLRHRLGTTAASHAANADAFFMFRSQLRLIDNAQFTPGQSVLFKLQPFTHEQDYDLTAVTPVTYVVSGFDNIAAPIFSPPGGSFQGSFVLHMTAQSGMTIRFTEDGSEVNIASTITAGAHAITSTRTIRARAFASNGRFSAERIATYTKTLQPPPPSQCSPPQFDFSGNQGLSAGTLTLTPTTAGSTIKFMKNGGSITTYTTPISLLCTSTGDTCEFWATLAGSDDSAHTYFDNTRQDVGGGGGRGPLP